MRLNGIEMINDGKSISTYGIVSTMTIKIITGVALITLTFLIFAGCGTSEVNVTETTVSATEEAAESRFGDGSGSKEDKVSESSDRPESEEDQGFDSSLFDKDSKDETSSVSEEPSYIEEPFYGVWVGASQDRSDALELMGKVSSKGFDADCIYSPEWDNLNREPYFCVTAGKAGTETEAEVLLGKAKDAGYKDAYIKFSGSRLGHRVYYYLYSVDSADITGSKVILNKVRTEDLSGDGEGERTLVVDSDTVFDESCDMQFFSGWNKGDSPLEWFNNANRSTEGEPALLGVYEVSVTGSHIDRYYGAYWWD